ncbi:outer membrane beta-barrel protein [Niabella pedocola]|uniref:Outer membrane beta-barrel protein n=1 Tax=Niabella pedocola TaxID=1752077 RepID=A0ABS8PWW4_9BACT|nr:outer membrane beta-barrel protein [Niabella pedocola]MCD2425533.1 outer membrane beta-barrel protein [Niabella pedocola]
MRTFIFTSILISSVLAANAQEWAAYQKQLIVGMGGGLSMPFKKSETADLMDARVGYRDRYWGLNPSLQVFVFKKWGFMADFQIDVSAVNKKQRAMLDQSFEARYSGDYEILTDKYFYGHGWQRYESPATFRFTAGPVYRFEKKHFLVYGSLGLGVTNFEVTGIRANLLRKNSNNYYNVLLDGRGTETPFTVTSGIRIGYRFSPHLILALNTNAAYFKTDFSQTMTRWDIYTGAAVVDGNFRYQRQHLNFSTNLNLQVAANFKKRR